MVVFFEIGINILEEFIMALFLTLYFGCKYKGLKKYVGFASIVLIAVATITYFNFQYIYEGVLGLVFIIIYYIYCLIFLKGDKYVKLFIVSFINCIIYFISLLSTLFIATVFTNDYDILYSVTYERVVMILLTKVLLVIACGILLKYRFPYAVKKKNAVVLICMTIATELSMVGIMQIFFQFSELTLDLLLASVSIMVINIITYYLFIRINHDIKVETEYSALQQRYENDKQHARDIEELYYKICGMRHDMMQHFTAISGMLDENGESAKEYIESVLKNQFDKIRYFIKTDNESFDAITNAKIAVCEAHNIKVQTRIMNNSLNKLLPDEIGVLFGNLFDNAIEAASCSKDRIIELDVQRQGEYLSVLMKNSIDKSVLKNNYALETTKENKKYHGFGTKNIKRIVDKYDGIINYIEENGSFVCDILI